MPRREVVLHVHLSPGSETARVDTNGRHLLTKEQVRDWCGNAATRITVRPVVDLNAHLHVDQYEVPDGMSGQVAERDVTCVFPWCTRTARACDTDHVVAYADGGPTASDNLAALCRHHHRHKTHHPGWTYTMLEPGT